MGKVHACKTLLNFITRADMQQMKSGGFGCCSFCNIIGQTVYIPTNDAMKNYRCYLPTQHSTDKTAEKFKRDAEMATWMKTAVHYCYYFSNSVDQWSESHTYYVQVLTLFGYYHAHAH